MRLNLPTHAPDRISPASHPVRDARCRLATATVRRALVGCLLLPSLLAAQAEADWFQFRGPQGRSVAGDDAALPTEWTAEQNTAWRVDLPGRGPSGPIVVGSRVYVTCSSGYHQDRLHVMCFDVESGKPLWHRQFWATGRAMTHPSIGTAAPTPASDGEAIYAFYSTNDLICLDLDGNLRWYRGLAYDFPKAGNDIGMSSSPVVADQTLVVQVENQGESFVAGVNTQTGETRWQLERPKHANWSSPVIARTSEGAPLVLVKSGEGLDAYDLESGLRRWTYETDAGGIPSVAVLPGQVILPADGVTALSLPSGKGLPQVRWSSNRINPGPASPVVTENRLYVINRAGVLTCADLESGELEWQLRLRGTFWGTPVLAGKFLYCINEAGLAQVVDLADEGKVVASNDFGETVQSSPAVSGGALFVRCDRSLWKIAAKP